MKGAKFRRQQPLGPYIVDFFCEQAGLVIEADGAHHFPAPEHDLERDALLRAVGLTVLRLPNHEVLEHPARALARIERALSLCSSPPLPWGEGVGGVRGQLPR